MALNRRATAPFGTIRGNFLLCKYLILGVDIFCFSFAALPAVSPITDKELEAEHVNFHAWLEANAEITEIHLVLLGMGEQKGQVASDGEEEIVVKW